MATSDQATHLPALGHHEREEIGHQLQATLVDLIDLSLIGKQLHWNVVGPLFRPLHLHLDELVDSWRELSDTVAERAVALGFAPDGQSRTVAGATSMAQLAAEPLEDQTVLRELTTRIAEAAERIRERMNRMGELDSASEDVLIEVVRALEQQLWMVRVQFAPHGH
jgi:starvation-inducible DNA-binding protein